MPTYIGFDKMQTLPSAGKLHGRWTVGAQDRTCHSMFKSVATSHGHAVGAGCVQKLAAGWCWGKSMWWWGVWAAEEANGTHWNAYLSTCFSEALGLPEGPPGLHRSPFHPEGSGPLLPSLYPGSGRSWGNPMTDHPNVGRAWVKWEARPPSGLLCGAL